MDKWTEMRKKVNEMSTDNFLLLADLTKERLKKIKKENIEHILNGINLTLQNLNCKLLDKDGYELSFPYLNFFYNEDNDTITLEFY